MGNELVTIVMSAFNAQDTITRAAESALSQTYADIELIIVDDASADGTRAVAERLAAGDSRVRVVAKSVNGGAGMARRDGVLARSAESRYLCFLDSDDWIERDYVETLYKAAREYNVDMVSAGMIVEDGGRTAREASKGAVVLERGGRGLQWVDPDSPGAIYFRFLNLSLTRSALWNRVSYCPRRFLEDTPTLTRLLYFANSRAVIPYAGYHYVQNPGSLCHTTDPKRRLIYTVLSAADSATFYKRHDEDAGDFLTGALGLLRQLRDTGITKEEQTLYKDELAEIALFLIDNIK